MDLTLFLRRLIYYMQCLIKLTKHFKKTWRKGLKTYYFRGTYFIYTFPNKLRKLVFIYSSLLRDGTNVYRIIFEHVTKIFNIIILIMQLQSKIKYSLKESWKFWRLRNVYSFFHNAFSYFFTYTIHFILYACKCCYFLKNF